MVVEQLKKAKRKDKFIWWIWNVCIFGNLTLSRILRCYVFSWLMKLPNKCKLIRMGIELSKLRAFGCSGFQVPFPKPLPTLQYKDPNTLPSLGWPSPSLIHLPLPLLYKWWCGCGLLSWSFFSKFLYNIIYERVMERYCMLWRDTSEISPSLSSFMLHFSSLSQVLKLVVGRVQACPSQGLPAPRACLFGRQLMR